MKKILAMVAILAAGAAFSIQAQTVADSLSKLPAANQAAAKMALETCDIAGTASMPLNKTQKKCLRTTKGSSTLNDKEYNECVSGCNGNCGFFTLFC